MQISSFFRISIFMVTSFSCSYLEPVLKSALNENDPLSSFAL